MEFGISIVSGGGGMGRRQWDEWNKGFGGG